MQSKSQSRNLLRRISRAAVAGLAILVVVMIVSAPYALAQTYSVLHNFTGGLDGKNPYAGLTMDAAGNLYGTIASSGTNGAVFKLTPGNGGWTFTSLHDFTGPPDGSDPDSTVAIGADGNLYGTTFHGGNCGGTGCGVVWEITP